MTPREQADFNDEVEAVRQMALIAAVTIEARNAAQKLRQRAGAAALQGLAEGAKALVLEAATTKDHWLNIVQNNASLVAVDGQDKP